MDNSWSESSILGNMNEFVKIVNVNYDFYEYLHLQTDTNKLDIPEMLLRGQQIDLFFLV